MKTMLVDLSRCNGCYNCQIACKDEHVDNDWTPIAKPQPDTGHFWMHVANIERGVYPRVKVAYLPKPCMMCTDPSCMKASKGDAVYKRNDGLVIIDPIKSKGQKQIVEACPYRVIYWNEALNIPQKCTFCAHLLDQGWKEPRCVESCPTDALVYGEYEELMGIANARGKQVELLNPEYELKPNVLYIDLPRRFIAGTVYLGDINECAENVKVTLTDEKGARITAKTNNYGDFEVEGLPADKKFTVTVEYKGYASQIFKADTKNDVYLGEIMLKRSKQVF